MENKEYIIPIDNNSYYQGRIVCYQTAQGHNADILITNVESGKILISVKQLFAYREHQELLQSAVQVLSDYLLKSMDKPSEMSGTDRIE